MVVIKYTLASPSGSNPVYALNLVRNLGRLMDLEVFTSAHSLFKGLNNLKIKNLLLPENHGILGNLRRMTRQWRKTNEEYGPDDIIIAVNPFEAVPFPRFRQILIIHDLIPLVYSKWYPLTSRYYRYILRFAVKSAAHLVTVSKSTRADIIRFYGVPESKVSVIYEGPGDALEDFEAANGSRIADAIGGAFILYVGGQSYHKNILNLLKAYKDVRNFCDEKLVLAGSSHHRTQKTLMDYCRSEGLTDRVIFLGPVQPGELNWLYRHATFLVLPSLYEGFGLTPLEAMVNRLPVVASNISSIPEICGDAAYYIDPCNVKDMADGMIKVVTDERLRKDLIERGLRRAEIYSWAKMAEDFVEVVKKVKTA